MRPLQWIIVFVWLAAVIAVQSIGRSEFFSLWGFYTIAFATYTYLVFSKNALIFSHGLILAIFCRLLGFFQEPQLSDDYFRFIWDGMIMHEGVNPIAYTPSYLLYHPEIVHTDAKLYSLLNSPDYYAVYPPVAQIIFYISYAINHLDITGHIIFYKSILLLVDLAVIFLLVKLLKQNNLSGGKALIYALNPLIIIEYTGNLHMEGLMIAGLLAAVLFSGKRSFMNSSLFMTFSICSKMISLILMPFMPREMYWKKIIKWSICTLLMTVIIFWLSFGSHSGWIESVGLWFQSFEFNASIYYIIRELHEVLTGYENIQITGPLMAVASGLLITLAWLFYLRKKNMHWSTAMVIAMTIYFLLTTTLHPWYLGTLLTLAVISGQSYPVVWSYLIFMSYSHYANGGFSEKYFYLFLEYSLLFLWMFFEFRKRDLRLHDFSFQK